MSHACPGGEHGVGRLKEVGGREGGGSEGEGGEGKGREGEWKVRGWNGGYVIMIGMKDVRFLDYF